MNEALYQIGSLAQKAQVNIQTIRYYERIKLLVPKLRKDSKKIRFYNDDSLKTLNFIRHAQELGFTLDEIKELLMLRAPATGRCQKAKLKASSKLSLIQEKIKLLKQMEKNLKKMINDCNDQSPSSSCPIIEGMEDFNA